MLTVAARQALLAAVPATHLSLHSTFPGANGIIGELATSRFPLAWQAPSGSTRVSDAIGITVPAGSTCAWLGLWSAASGGTFHGAVPLEGEAREYHTLPASDRIVAPGHGYADGQAIVFWGGTAPAPLVEGTVYYARDVLADSFRVAVTVGGSAINLTADGAGDTFVSRIRVFTANGDTVLSIPRLIVSAVNPAPIVSGPAISWTGTPAPQFTAGVAGAYDVSGFVSDYSGASDIITLAPSSAALPTGITFIGTSFVASGTHVTGSTINVTLRATRGVQAADSAAITISIVAPVSWTGTPSPQFSALQAGSYSVTSFVSNYSASTDVITLAPTSAALPTGVTFNGTAFVASGSQIAGTTSGIRLRVTRQGQIVDSPAFGVVVATASSGSTIVASNASQAAVQAAINAANHGDRIIVPAGAATWAGLTINKAVDIQCAGRGQTIITCGAGNTITKQAAGITRLRGLSMSKTGGGTNSYAWTISGGWKNAEPVVIEDVAITVSNSGFFRTQVVGGLILANGTINAEWDDSFLHPVGLADYESWHANHSIGNADTFGKWNIYLEDFTIYGGGNQGIDVDNGGRAVVRYCTFKYGSVNSHGLDTSQRGVRHLEVYHCDFQYARVGDGQSQTLIANVNQVIWLRGGTGVFWNNVVDDYAGGYWGDKSELKLDCRAQNDNSGATYGLFSDGRAKYSAGVGAYPRQHQVGQGWSLALTNAVGANGGVGDYVLDPVYCWGNTGAGANAQGGFKAVGIDNFSIANGGSSVASYIVAGRDYYNNGTPRPGYAPFTYPHPLRVT